MRHIIFVHGIGTVSYKIARSFEKSILPEIRHMDVDVHTFWWRGAVEKKESKIQKIVARMPKGVLSLNLNVKDAIETYLIVRLRQLLIGYFGDAVFYLSDNSRKIRKQLEGVVLSIGKEDNSARISIVAHSMGSVIAFDLLSGSSFARKMKRQRISIENFFTVGSPLSLFLLRPAISVKKPLPVAGEWINIYDKRDVIASPLNPIFRQCRDYEVKIPDANALTAHLRYFTHAEVINKILRTM